ncbi:site-specific DNA-methyltransferase [uncultured Brachyspira sp.]|uniref:DNA-methyltransferase n=2 Tax=uncultured Brachyspira sp. TaxID=221953 RepID=UPI0025ED8E1A|nr:site-specific DNA-methyltransferase [uncultured Brachyspira sp.]
MLINDDCLNALSRFEDEYADMVYLDPPFFTQKNQSLYNKDGDYFEFNDKWNSLDEYLEYIIKRLLEIKRVLKKTGSIFLHSNTSASHHLRILLDNVFGKNNFRSEIIWTYKRWSNSKKGLLNSHQNIYFYSKTDNFTFNKIFTDYSLTTNLDQILQNRRRNDKNKIVYQYNDNGNLVTSKEKNGVPLSDVWEIPYLNPKAKERVGYPTQKPILLLEKIILLSTNINDIIIDPFMGSGTTLVAAKLLNRKHIGIDINKSAVELAEKRLKNPIKTDSKLLKIGKEAYDNKTDFQKNILNQIDCNIVQRNRAIDGILKQKYKNKHVLIKIQEKDKSINETIKSVSNAMKNKNSELAIIIRTNSINDLIYQNVEKNIFIIDSYNISINNYIKNLIE